MLKWVIESGRIARILVVFSIISIGCGGSSAAGNGGTDAYDQSPAEAAVAEAQSDPKLEEAKNRCDQEIKKSELQPPDTLTTIQVHACIYAIKPEIAKCTTGPKREVTLKIVVEKTGDVSNAFPIGDTADCPEAKCIADAVKGIAFPKFKAQNQQIIKYPFTLGE